MSRGAYEEGVVLVRCPGCKNQHLIADNLGWFDDERVNIEDIMREKGEEIKKINEWKFQTGDLEYIPESQISEASSSAVDDKDSDQKQIVLQDSEHDDSHNNR